MRIGLTENIRMREITRNANARGSTAGGQVGRWLGGEGGKADLWYGDLWPGAPHYPVLLPRLDHPHGHLVPWWGELG